MWALPGADAGEHSDAWSAFKDRVGRGWYKFRRNPTALIGAFMVAAAIIIAVFAHHIAPYPRHVGAVTDFRNAFARPTLSRPFGTDDVGRDLLSRVMFGTRISLTLAAVVLGIAAPFGVFLGLVAGYFGGRIERVVMRLTDMFLPLPPLIMALAITAALPPPSLTKSMFALCVIWWTWHCRLVNNIVRSLRNEEFVLASRILGASHLRIIFKDILPNCASAIIVKITLDAGFVILIGAGLSFLGLGAQPPSPDLGTMVAIGAKYLPEMWWMTIFPSLAIFLIILGFNLLGDGLRDALAVEERI